MADTIDATTGSGGSQPGQAASTSAPAVSRTHRLSFKSRMLVMWNNARHAQLMRISFSTNSPVWILGEMYHPRPPSESDDPGSNNKRLFLDLRSRILLTYRQGFPPLLGSHFSTDTGWGCMIRTGQMMTAQVLTQLMLGRSWRVSGASSGKASAQRAILRLFDDMPQSRSAAPLSLGSLLQYSLEDGKQPGDWLGPTAAARCLSRAINGNIHTLIRGHGYQPFVSYLAYDCIIFKDEVRATISASGAEWRPVFFIVPVRLGLRAVDDVYLPSLKAAFTHAYCLGIMGGRPRHSLYFVGYQDDSLIGLDPHHCQQVVDMSDPAFSTGSYECSNPRKVPFTSVDPSMAIGFLARTPEELEELYLFAEDPKLHRGSPLFSVAEKSPE